VLWQDGIRRLNDLYKDDGTMIKYNELPQEAKLNLNIFQYIQIVNAIPSPWKKYIRCNYGTLKKDFYNIPIKLGGKLQDLLELNLKTLYQDLVSNKLMKSKANERYSDVYTINENEWSLYYEIPYKVKTNNRVREFQYKILHRYLPTNRLLYLMKLTDSQRCNFCFLYTQTIEHLLWECLCVHNIWISLINLINQNFNTELELNIKIVLFGIPDTNEAVLTIVNRIILYTKYFIFKCKLQNDEILFNNLIFYLNKKM